jgi:hypothetical protein
MVRDGQRKGVADRVAVAQEVDCLAAIAHAIRFEELAPLLERSARLAGYLADICDVS